MRVRKSRRIHQRLLGMLSAFALGLAITESGAAADWEHFPQIGRDDFLSNVITAVARDSTSRIWAGTDRGLAWSADGGQNWNYVHLESAIPRMRGRRRDADATPPAAPAKVSGGEPFILRNTITCIAAGRGGVWVGTRNGLSFGNEELTNWELCGRDAAGPGPEIWAVAEYLGEVWVSSSTGIYKSSNHDTWQKLPGQFPRNIRSITLGEGSSGRACWLSGFDAAEQYGGAPDVLRSMDGGKSWVALKPGTASAIGRVVSTRVYRTVLDGQWLWAATNHGLALSEDGGDSWATVSAGTGLNVEEVFDLARMDNGLWAATSEGPFVSADQGVSWRHDGHLSCPVRVLCRDGRQLWMATNGGLICRTRNAELKSFSVRSNVLSIAVTTAYGVETWWVGTTGGLAYTRDGGKSWRSVTVANGLPSNVILSLSGQGDRVWLGTDGGVCEGLEGDEGWRCYSRQHGLHGLTVNDILAEHGNVWAATNRGLSLMRGRSGEWRSFQRTKEWRQVCKIGENLYGAVNDLLDPGRGASVIMGNTTQDKWRTLRIRGHHGLPIHELLAAGEDLWMASDNGLFRSRDAGETWARFGAESLWSSRVTCLCSSDPNLLCAQAVPNDPPSPTAFLNVTRDVGRSWLVLPQPIPGHATAMKVIGDRILVGSVQAQVGATWTRGDLAAHSLQELRTAHSGRLAWTRIAGCAAATWRGDKLGWVSAVDSFAFHGPTVWLGSRGSGAVERGQAVVDDAFRTWDIAGRTPFDVHPISLLDGEDILAIAEAPEGVWFGTATGLYFYDRLGQVQTWRPARGGLRAAPVRAVAVRGDEVWAGTDQGLSVLNVADAAWRTFVAGASPLPNNSVTALASDGEKIWGGTARGAFVVDQAGNWRTMLDEEKVSEERISSVAIGATREYFGTAWGVFGLDRDGKQQRHIEKVNYPVLPDDDVLRVFVDGPEVWAATAGGVSKILYDAAEAQPSPAVEPSRRGPEGVLVVVNDRSQDSQQIGDRYAALRKVPPENVCHIRCALDEVTDRAAFEKDIQQPLRKCLAVKKLSRRISFIVTTLGVPLRIAPETDSSGAVRPGTAVDSELALLGAPRPLTRRFENPYLHRDEPFNSTLFGMYLVTRLDGPTKEAALALVNDGAMADSDRVFGARGFARFAMLPTEDESAGRINAAVWVNYRALSKLERLSGRVTPPVKDSPPFFRPDQAVNTFFFLGVGLAEYRPEVFSWVKGAIAIDLDRVTASSLRNSKASWVAGALAGRVCATIGNVADPGPDGVPSVADLFHSIKAGYTWAEAAYMCIPYLCGQTIVLGDPLYTPIK